MKTALYSGSVNVRCRTGFCILLPILVSLNCADRGPKQPPQIYHGIACTDEDALLNRLITGNTYSAQDLNIALDPSINLNRGIRFVNLEKNSAIPGDSKEFKWCYTPLGLACYQRQFISKKEDAELLFDKMKVLIEHGASAERDPAVLFYAIMENRLDLVSFILDKGTDVNALRAQVDIVLVCQNRGYTPAIIKPVEQKICRNGESPPDESVIDTSSFMYPIHIAAAAGSREMVNLLLSHNADCALKDSKGKTALQWAQARGDRDTVIVERIRSALHLPEPEVPLNKFENQKEPITPQAAICALLSCGQLKDAIAYLAKIGDRMTTTEDYFAFGAFYAALAEKVQSYQWKPQSSPPNPDSLYARAASIVSRAIDKATADDIEKANVLLSSIYNKLGNRIAFLECLEAAALSSANEVKKSYYYYYLAMCTREETQLKDGREKAWKFLEKAIRLYRYNYEALMYMSEIADSTSKKCELYKKAIKALPKFEKDANKEYLDNTMRLLSALFEYDEYPDYRFYYMICRRQWTKSIFEPYMRDSSAPPPF